MSASDQINHTLELLAERVDDPTPLVYARFYARSPEGEALLHDKPPFIQGKMLNELIQAVVEAAEDRRYLPVVIETEVNSHNVWGVTRQMYDALFDAFIETIAEVLGEDFEEQAHQAWRGAFNRLLQLIGPYAKTQGNPITSA
jgi:hemoglobin-like flavoprotein